MGRKKLEIKRIEDKSNRQVTFSPREEVVFLRKLNNFLFFVTFQLLLLFSPILANSINFPTPIVLLQYFNNIKPFLMQTKRKPMEFMKMSNRAEGDLLQGVERDLAEINPDQLNVANLMQLETELETALVQTRAAMVSVNTQLMMETITTLQEKIAEMGQENIAAKEKDNIDFCNLAGDETDHAPGKETLMLLC